MSEMTSEQISQGIQGLTDEAFDRVQAHVDGFASDERRHSHDGNGLILANHISVFKDLENRYGFMDLKICQSASALAVAKSVVTSPIIQGALTELDLLNTNRDRFNGAIAGGLSRFNVLHDRHARGWTGGMGDPNVWAGPEYDPDVWGERSRIGVNTNVVFSGANIPGFEVWELGLRLSDRFDKPGSQTKITVKTKQFDTGTQPAEENKPEVDNQELTHQTTADEIEFVAGALRQAKDLRPVVDPINRHIAYSRFIEAAHAKLLGQEEPAAA